MWDKLNMCCFIINVFDLATTAYQLCRDVIFANKDITVFEVYTQYFVF